MKTKFFLSVLLLTSTMSIISCKNEEKKAEENPATEIKKENPKTFKVILNVIAKKDDSFHLFFSEDGTLNFSEENSVWANFKGSEVAQDLVFEIPEDKLPTLMRIDLNSYQQNESVQINSFKMKYYNSEFKADGKSFFDYFGPNTETVEVIDKDKVIFKPLVKEGKKYTPPSFFPSEEALKTRVEQVIKGATK